jgi:hypothetical protein
MIKYHFDIEQNTPEWDQIRMGKLTGSTASEFLVKGKSESGLGTGAITLIYKKAAEWITQCQPYQFGNQYTDRGHDMEYLGICEYEDATFDTVVRPGFVERSSYVGCSPDGLIYLGESGKKKRLLEMKCPEQAEYMRVVDLGLKAVQKSYIAQVQFNMWVCGCMDADLVYYHPKFMDKKLITFRILPDPAMVERFEWAEKIFKEEVQRLTGLVMVKELI